MNTTSDRTVPRFSTEGEVAGLVTDFELCVIEREDWNHRAHLAVAMWYLAHHPESIARALMIRGIRRYNHAKGIGRAPKGGYHETLTLFWLRMGRELVERHPEHAPLELVNRFVELPKELPERCYSRERLWSDEAREGWIPPDLMAVTDLVSELEALTV